MRGGAQSGVGGGVGVKEEGQKRVGDVGAFFTARTQNKVQSETFVVFEH